MDTPRMSKQNKQHLHYWVLAQQTLPGSVPRSSQRSSTSWSFSSTLKSNIKPTLSISQVFVFPDQPPLRKNQQSPRSHTRTWTLCATSRLAALRSRVDTRAIKSKPAQSNHGRKIDFAETESTSVLPRGRFTHPAKTNPP